MDKAKVVAMACEDEHKLRFLNLSCSDKFQDVNQIHASFSAVMARCPPPHHCDTSGVVGDNTGYAPESPICASAVHSGKLKKTKAGQLLTLINGYVEKVEFKGSEKNGITSTGIKVKNPVPKFQLDTFEFMCPQNA